MLQGIDTLVLDLQDIGSRFYTYMTTMGYVMEEAAKRKIAVVVLDRPNPIGGAAIEGPLVDQSELSFAAYHPDARPARDDAGRTGAAVQRRAEDRRRPHRRRDEVLGPRQLVRPDRPDVDQPVAEHAEHGGGEPLHGHRRHRGVEPLGGARHRLAVRAVRRAVDRRPAAGRGAEPAEPARRALLPDQLHARVQPVRERALPRRLHHRHRPRAAEAGARRGWKWRRRSTGCSRRRSRWTRWAGCSARTPSSASGPGKTRRPSPRPGRAANRRGGCCARNTCATVDLRLART